MIGVSCKGTHPELLHPGQEVPACSMPARRAMPTPQQREVAAVLLDAIGDNQTERATDILLGGADPEIALEKGTNPLGLACDRGKLDMVQLLLRHGADVNSRDPEATLPLFKAIFRGHLCVVRELLAAGANPNGRDEVGHNPLHWLAHGGMVEVMRELIRAGAQLDAVNIDGYAPIHTSAKVGDLPTLHELVEAGSSHAWRTLDNETPLTLACLGGHSDCVEYLVHKCKADPGARGYLEKTPLANAASKGHLAVVKVLLRCGVHRLGSNAFQEALFSVAMHARIDVLRELIAAEGGVHVNRTNTAYSMSALHIAAGFCHPLATSMLLEAGADEFAEDRNGQTPFVVTDTLRHEEVQHGVGGGRRVWRMLTQGPAYRAWSWKWPVASTSPPAPSASKLTRGEAEEAGPAKGEEEPVEMTDEDLDRAFDVALAVTLAKNKIGKIRVSVFRRPVTSSSGSATEGNSMVVASLIRYCENT